VVSTKLGEAFRDFDALARSKLQLSGKATIRREIAKFPTESTLPVLVNEIEKGEQFHNLVLETQEAFVGDYHRSKSEKNWRNASHNFLSQSGYYLDLIGGKDFSSNEIFAGYCNAFKVREAKTIYLAPLEFVTFAQDYMDFGTFRVRRFSLRELEAKFRNRINKLFYPYAAFTQERLELLSQYWFVEAEKFGDVSAMGWLRIPVSPSSRVVFTGYAERICTDYPEPIELALRELCLFDWAASDRKYHHEKHVKESVVSDKEDEFELWLKFKVPFVIEVKQDLLSSPEPVPNILALQTLPDIDSTGEEYEGPEVHIRLDESETNYFMQFTRSIGDILHSIEFGKNGWDFFENALGYFTKAFFDSPGLEQLLWHIVTIEALIHLDEEKETVTETLAKRIGSILGRTNAERKDFRKRFKELYDVRSSLVHGKTKAKAHVTELVDAYRFSRRAVLWFLHYLGDIQGRIRKGEVSKEVPTHKEILTLLDIDTGSRNRVKWLMEGLPKEFPHMSEWMK